MNYLVLFLLRRDRGLFIFIIRDTSTWTERSRCALVKRHRVSLIAPVSAPSSARLPHLIGFPDSYSQVFFSYSNNKLPDNGIRHFNSRWNYAFCMTLWSVTGEFHFLGRGRVGGPMNHSSMFDFMCAYKYIISVIGRKSRLGYLWCKLSVHCIRCALGKKKKHRPFKKCLIKKQVWEALTMNSITHKPACWRVTR